MNKRNILVVAIITALLGTGAALAGGGYCEKGQGGRHGHGGMYGMHMLSHLEGKLDLTDEQSLALESLFESRRSARGEHHLARHELMSRALYLDPGAETYDAEVEKLADEVAEMARQRALEMAEMQKGIADVLTAEQQDELRQMIEKRLERRMKHRGHDKGA